MKMFDAEEQMYDSVSQGLSLHEGSETLVLHLRFVTVDTSLSMRCKVGVVTSFTWGFLCGSEILRVAVCRVTYCVLFKVLYREYY